MKDDGVSGGDQGNLVRDDERNHGESGSGAEQASWR